MSVNFSRQWLTPCERTGGVFIACLSQEMFAVRLAPCTLLFPTHILKCRKALNHWQVWGWLYEEGKIRCKLQVEERQYQAGTTEVWVQVSAHSQIACIIFDETFSFSMHQLLICKLRMNNHSLALAFYLKCKLLGLRFPLIVDNSTSAMKCFSKLQKNGYRYRISLLFVNSLAWVWNSHAHWAQPISSSGPWHWHSSWSRVLY